MTPERNSSFFADQMRQAKAAVRDTRTGSERQTSIRQVMTNPLPRLCFAGVAADSGTTAVHLSVIAALRRAGQTVQAFHAAGAEQEAILQSYVSGRLPHMLDPLLYDPDTLNYLIYKHAYSCRLATFEASGGYFDGLYRSERDHLYPLGTAMPGHTYADEQPSASTYPGGAAHNETGPTRGKDNNIAARIAQDADGSAAKLCAALRIPTILILRPRGSRQSILLTLKAYIEEARKLQRDASPAGSTVERGSCIKGVILNEVRASTYEELRHEIESVLHIPVLGYVEPLPPFSLKLSTAAIGDPDAAAWTRLRRAIDSLAERATLHLDIDRMLKIADSAPELPVSAAPGLLALQRETRALGSIHIAVPLDRAFFSYDQDSLELLAESGAKLSTFSPLEDAALPAGIHALYLGGLFCRDIIPRLSRDERLSAVIRRMHEYGLPIWAEGQGAVYLSRFFVDSDGVQIPMANVLPVESYADPVRAEDYDPQRLYTGEAKLEDLRAEYSNPRGISRWDAPYCILRPRRTLFVAQAGRTIPALGEVSLIRSRDHRGMTIQARTGEIQNVLLSSHAMAIGARIPLYTEPELVLRLMRAAAAFRDRKTEGPSAYF